MDKGTGTRGKGIEVDGKGSGAGVLGNGDRG